MINISVLEPPVPIMTPGAGERLLKFVGDKVLFTLQTTTKMPADGS